MSYPRSEPQAPRVDEHELAELRSALSAAEEIWDMAGDIDRQPAGYDIADEVKAIAAAAELLTDLIREIAAEAGEKI